MVIKSKSNKPIEMIKEVSEFSSWDVPSLKNGNKNNFFQPIEDKQNPSVEKTEQLNKSKEEFDSGYEKGFSQGLKDGSASAKDDMEEQKELFLNLTNSLSEPIKLCGEKTQQQLIELSFAIARQILRRELQQDPTQLIGIIREALNLLPIATQEITILLHPEDAVIVKDKLSIDSESKAGRWEITVDPSIERGSCQVNTKNSNVDASIDKQIAVLFSRVAGGQRAGE